MRIKKKKRTNQLTYVGGNWLRGFAEGEFKSMEQAWSYLSTCFLLSFPCPTGRSFYMYVKKKNEFGFEQLLICKEGLTEINKLTKRGVRIKCRPSNHRLL